MINGEINICAVVEMGDGDALGGWHDCVVGRCGLGQGRWPGPDIDKWTASAGTLSGSDGSSVTLTCPVGGGNVSVTFEVSDSDCSDKIHARQRLV